MLNNKVSLPYSAVQRVEILSKGAVICIRRTILKLRFSEKAAKIWKYLPLILTLLSKRWRFFQIYLNFIKTGDRLGSSLFSISRDRFENTCLWVTLTAIPGLHDIMKIDEKSRENSSAEKLKSFSREDFSQLCICSLRHFGTLVYYFENISPFFF